MTKLSSSELQRISQRIFEAAGMPKESANQISHTLVEANLMGHDSHGVIRVIEYTKAIQTGRVDPLATPKAVRETTTTLLVDGHLCLGQLVAGWTMEKLIQKASQHYLAAGSIFHCGHIGRVGTYPQMAAERGFISLAFANGGGRYPRVAPHGGKRPIFGTNPLAAAFPVKDQPPVVMDFSTSIVASGKIRVLRDKDEELPDGWILDKRGRPSNLPEDYYDGGMLLPIAGHKGYGLSLLVEVLAGFLGGAGTPSLPESGYVVGNGVFFIVLNIEAFRPLSDFAIQVDDFTDYIKSTPPLDVGSEVLLPGEIENRTKTHRLSEGITIPEKTWKSIIDVAKSVGVEI